MTYLTGDRYLETLVHSTDLLVRGVHEDDTLAVDAAFADAEQVYGDPLDGARALVVLLAARVPDDSTAAQQLQWRSNPHEYRRLRRAGVSAEQAATLAATVRPITKAGAA